MHNHDGRVSLSTIIPSGDKQFAKLVYLSSGAKIRHIPQIKGLLSQIGAVAARPIERFSIFFIIRPQRRCM
jgi:hypothetical protein